MNQNSLGKKLCILPTINSMVDSNAAVAYHQPLCTHVLLFILLTANFVTNFVEQKCVQSVVSKWLLKQILFKNMGMAPSVPQLDLSPIYFTHKNI